MGYLLFEDRHSTLQTGFDFTYPEFQVGGRSYLGYPFDYWMIVEHGYGVDGQFRPGESIILTAYDLVSDQFDAFGAVLAVYEGLIDLDGNGWLDSALISVGSAEYVLTDLKAYLSFTPFLTRVDLNKVSVSSTPFPPKAVVPQVPSSAFDYEFFGNGKGQKVVGTGGRDLLFGGGGSDQLLGLGGNDVLSGDSGRDVIWGGDGGDAIWGGSGVDVLDGGGGADYFWIDTRNRFDKIKNFSEQDVVVIDVDTKAFSGVGKSDIKIVDGRAFDKLVIDGDLVAKVYGDEIDRTDVWFL